MRCHQRDGPTASLRDLSKRPFDRLVGKRRPSADNVPHLRGARSLDVHQSQRLAVKRVLDQVVGAARDLNTTAAAMNSMRLARLTVSPHRS